MDPQGAFYYGDFRFLAAATLGIGTSSFDRILAYLIHRKPEFADAIFFYPAVGGIKKRDVPGQDLRRAVGQPFDTIRFR